MAVHKKCHDKIMGKCPGSGRESESTIVSIPKQKKKLIANVDFIVGVDSIWGSVSKLTCHIVSSCTRSCHPRSAITAALCFTVFINRVINAKVSERFYLFISTLLLWEVANTSALPNTWENVHFYATRTTDVYAWLPTHPWDFLCKNMCFAFFYSIVNRSTYNENTYALY